MTVDLLELDGAITRIFLIYGIEGLGAVVLLEVDGNVVEADELRIERGHLTLVSRKKA